MAVHVVRQRRRGAPRRGSSPGAGWRGTRYVVRMQSPPTWRVRHLGTFTSRLEASTYAEWAREFDRKGLLEPMLDARGALRRHLTGGQVIV